MARRMYATAKSWLMFWAASFMTTVMVVNVLYTNELDLRKGEPTVNINRPWGPDFHESPGSRHADARDVKVVVQELDPQSQTDDSSAEGPQRVEVPAYFSRKDLKLWPDEAPTYDRIPDQLKYMPSSNSSDLKTIYLTSPFANAKMGREQFIQDKCPVNSCFLTRDGDMMQTADAMLFKSAPKTPNVQRPPGQVWILYLLESPYHSGGIPIDLAKSKAINWTATYRRDSTLVAPYEKFVHFDNFQALPPKPKRDYALGKTKMAAWFVTNCKDKNGRLEYAHQLQKHAQVDIYGNCGTLKCPRAQAGKCFKMLNTDYKFYLSFENSNCQDYITEKLYWNALFNDIVPIVMGARPEDYAAVAPPHSYIHVDDFESPEALAKYLHMLDKNDTAYNEYFRWKDTGEFINTKFFCRLCAMLHAREADGKVTWVDDLSKWWKGAGVCLPRGQKPYSSWRERFHIDANNDNNNIHNGTVANTPPP